MRAAYGGILCEKTRMNGRNLLDEREKTIVFLLDK